MRGGSYNLLAMNKTFVLTVVIPTLGRPILERTLGSLIQSDEFEDLAVIVVGHIADPDVAGTVRAMCAQHANIRHLDLSFSSGDSSRKKNAGWRAAQTELIAFLDDDVIVAHDWSYAIRAPFSDGAVGLVSGPSLVPDDLALMARLSGGVLASWAAGYVAGRYKSGVVIPRPVGWSMVIGCNMAYRRSALEAAGGFDPAFWPGEEMLAAFRVMRLGFRLMFHPGAKLYHYPRASLVGFCRQMYGYGATRIRLIRAGVDCELTTLLPGALVLLFLGLPLAAIFYKGAVWALLGFMALYGTAVAAIALLKYFETLNVRDLLIFLLVPVMHASYGVAEWSELLRPNRDLSEHSFTKKAGQ